MMYQMDLVLLLQLVLVLFYSSLYSIDHMLYIKDTHTHTYIYIYIYTHYLCMHLYHIYVYIYMRAGIYLVTNSHPQVFGVARGNIFSRFASQRRWDGMSRTEVGNLHTNFSSPTRWFSSRFVTRPTNRNRNGRKMDFLTFLENARR